MVSALHNLRSLLPIVLLPLLLAGGAVLGAATNDEVADIEVAELDVVRRVLRAASADALASARAAQVRAASSTASRRLPLLRALMGDPLRASYRVGLLANAVEAELDSPLSLLNVATSLAGAEVHRPAAVRRAIDTAAIDGDDALLVAVRAVAASAGALACGSRRDAGAGGRRGAVSPTRFRGFSAFGKCARAHSTGR